MTPPGPLLLTRTNAAPERTLAELRRLRPDRVVVLGGPPAVGDEVAAALGQAAQAPVQRLAGSTRFATAAQISRAEFDPGVPAVFIANGLRFPDALSAAPVAAAAGGPILLSGQNSLPAATREELTRLRPDRIVVLGGPPAVSEQVAAELADLTGGPVQRYQGPNRYATSAAVLEESGLQPDAVLIVTGESFPDGLAAGPAAIVRGGAVLLSRPTSVPPVVQTQLRRVDPTVIALLGSEAALAPAVAAQLGQIQDGCDDAYPDVCIPIGPPDGPDLNCGDVAHTNFAVLPPDPHNLDADSDGVGCEDTDTGQDDPGGPETEDPTPTPEPAPPPRPDGVPGDTQPATVTAITDGDTLTVTVRHTPDVPGALPDGDHRVRLLSIDAPETVDPDEPVQCGGPEATQYLQDRLAPGEQVWLQADVEHTDRFGRALRYLWTDDGDFLNLHAARDGVVQVVLFEPNDRHITQLRTAQQQAQSADRGLWGPPCDLDAPPPPPAPPPAEECDPAYPDVCIPPRDQVGDLNCGDIPHRRFRVLPPDPHNFDGDNDGVGCESD